MHLRKSYRYKIEGLHIFQLIRENSSCYKRFMTLKFRLQFSKKKFLSSKYSRILFLLPRRKEFVIATLPELKLRRYIGHRMEL